jgi:uncharacterized protein (UPF0332 family)
MVLRKSELRHAPDYKTFKPISKEKAQETLSKAVYFVDETPYCWIAC